MLGSRTHPLPLTARRCRRRRPPSSCLRLPACRVGVIDGLQVGEMLGRGAYGRVYKGRWKGAQVAVKVVEQRVGADQVVDLSREPLLRWALRRALPVISGFSLSACLHVCMMMFSFLD